MKDEYRLEVLDPIPRPGFSKAEINPNLVIKRDPVMIKENEDDFRTKPIQGQGLYAEYMEKQFEELNKERGYNIDKGLSNLKSMPRHHSHLIYLNYLLDKWEKEDKPVPPENEYILEKKDGMKDINDTVKIMIISYIIITIIGLFLIHSIIG